MTARQAVQALVYKAEDNRSAEDWERQALLMALWYIASGEGDPKNIARTALGLPLEHPGYDDVRHDLEDDDDLPF